MPILRGRVAKLERPYPRVLLLDPPPSPKIWIQPHSDVNKGGCRADLDIPTPIWSFGARAYQVGGTPAQRPFRPHDPERDQPAGAASTGSSLPAERGMGADGSHSPSGFLRNLIGRRGRGLGSARMAPLLGSGRGPRFADAPSAKGHQLCADPTLELMAALWWPH